MTDRDQAIQWARNIMKEDFVVLDTETTGLEDDDEAVSIGLIDKFENVLLDTLLRHEKPSHPKALAVHGHTWEETRDAPLFTEVWPQFVELIKDKSLVIYNATYDTRIIEQMMVRYGISDTAPIFRADATCAMNWFAIFYGEPGPYGDYKWQKLTTAARYFGISTAGAHGAVADCLMTLRVVRRMATQNLSTEAKQ